MITGDTHSLQIENRRLHKVMAKVTTNEGRGTERGAVWSQGAHNQHLPEVITDVLPISYKEKQK